MIETSNFIGILEDLIHCWKCCHDPNSGVQKEIHMWRSRFLKDKNATSYEESVFHSIPSSNLMKETPEKLFDDTK